MSSKTLIRVEIMFLSLALGLPGFARDLYGEQAKPIVAVFAGHTESLDFQGNHRGSKSASGIHECFFNDAVVNLIQERANSRVTYVTIPASLNIPLKSRPGLAKRLGAVALIEIHHDSVQAHIYSKLIGAKPPNQALQYYRGFSIHVFPDPEAIKLAQAIESQIMASSVPLSAYHQEDIPGERMKLVPGTKASYERTQLYLLRNSSIPTVILECGCIANPEEEKILKDQKYLERLTGAIHRGVLGYLGVSYGSVLSPGESK